MAFGQFSRTSKQEITPGGDISKPVVLIIDDDSELRYALQKNLQKKYDVRSCGSGEEGLLAIDHRVCAVILDIKMPGKDGFQVYNEIKLRYPDMPIIFYSAYQDVLEGAKLRKEYNPFNYFDKSDNVKNLLDCVDRAAAMCANIQKILTVEENIKFKK